MNEIGDGNPRCCASSPKHFLIAETPDTPTKNGTLEPAILWEPEKPSGGIVVISMQLVLFHN
jgi:hypothetical protein